MGNAQLKLKGGLPPIARADKLTFNPTHAVADEADKAGVGDVAGVKVNVCEN